MPAIAPRSSVVYNGVDAPAAPLAPPPPGPPRLLCVGRLVAKKGFDLASDAFASLRRSRQDARLTIAGDGPEREALQAQAVRLGVGP